jgi:hypothetical protein
MLLIPRLSFAVGLATAIIASQLPEFAQQYRQGLIGAVGELSREVAKFDSDAKAIGLSEAEAIAHLRQSPDTLAQQQGEARQDEISRLHMLQGQLDDFVKAGPVSRILVLAGDIDPTIAARAYANFEPAVPTTTEGIISAIVGFFLGGGLLRVCAIPFRRRARPEPPPLPIVDARNEREEIARARDILLRERINRYTLPRPTQTVDKDRS